MPFFCSTDIFYRSPCHSANHHHYKNPHLYPMKAREIKMENHEQTPDNFYSLYLKEPLQAIYQKGLSFSIMSSLNAHSLCLNSLVSDNTTRHECGPSPHNCQIQGQTSVPLSTVKVTSEGKSLNYKCGSTHNPIVIVPF